MEERPTRCMLPQKQWRDWRHKQNPIHLSFISRRTRLRPTRHPSRRRCRAICREPYQGISMDGRGRWMDNVFIERLWRSLKYECVFLNAFETGSEARAGIGRWID